MSPVAVRLLQFHKSHPDRATFTMQEMATEGYTLGQIDTAYQELLSAGFVQPSGQFVSVNPHAGRPCYKVTQSGLDARPAITN